MAEANSDGGQKRPGAPYVGFPSFKNMVGGFRQHVTPSRIDRSVLSNFSGIVGSQLLQALRFFGHIDGQGKPTEHLPRLIEAFGSEEWASTLEAELKRAYAPIFELDLKTASPAQFTETFRAAYPAEGDTLRKALTFFLSAARDAQISVNTYIMKNKKPRSGNGTKKPKAAQTSTPRDKDADGKPKDDRRDPGGTSGEDFRRELLNKFPDFDPSWNETLKAEWFKGFDQFMQMSQKK